MITQKRLKEVLDYDAEKGVFRWKISTRKIKVGKVAGTNKGNGYIGIQIDGKIYQAHRLAWLYVYGYFPKKDTDHINMIKSDNRINNLRESERWQNMGNIKKFSNNKSGYKGVCFYKRDGNWKAQIRANGVLKHLGYFPTKELAADAYDKAATIGFEEFRNLNFSRKIS